MNEEALAHWGAVAPNKKKIQGSVGEFLVCFNQTGDIFDSCEHGNENLSD